MKQVLRETQTLRTGCSKAETKNFAPPQTPFPEAQDGQNLITYRLSLHAISSYRGNRPTNTPINTPTHTQTNKQTHRQNRLQYTAPLCLARSVTTNSSSDFTYNRFLLLGKPSAYHTSISGSNNCWSSCI